MEFLVLHYITYRKIGSPDLGEVTAATRAALPIPASVCSVLMCPNNSMVANVWDFQRAHRCWLMHTITHGGCTNIVRKSTLKADSGRNPCRTRESNPRQYGAWLFGSVLHQLNGPTLICTKHMSRALKVMMHGMMSVVKPVLNWANVFFAEHTSDSSTNYNSFLN